MNNINNNNNNNRYTDHLHLAQRQRHKQKQQRAAILSTINLNGYNGGSPVMFKFSETLTMETKKSDKNIFTALFPNTQDINNNIQMSMCGYAKQPKLISRYSKQQQLQQQLQQQQYQQQRIQSNHNNFFNKNVNNDQHNVNTTISIQRSVNVNKKKSIVGFKCPYCNKTFKLKDNWSAHVKTLLVFDCLSMKYLVK